MSSIENSNSGSRPDTVLEPGEIEFRARLQIALGADYELGALMGQGGMGAVYAARDHRLDRDVAVKTLRYDVFPSRVTIERFQREVKALAKLRHPNILPVYAVGEGQGLAFMITPRIEGTNLGDLIERGGALSWSDAARIASEIARALDAAHRVGVIHRDVKPDNILLEGDERHALLADFGIAKSAQEESALTASGMMLGSPRYMSPEQVNGDAVDHRADIYALGAVAYEMLSGRPPFDGDNFQRVVVQKVTSDPPALSSVAPTVPAALAAIVERCLARDPRARWDSAAAVADALAEHTRAPRGEPAELRSSWFARRGPVGFMAFVLFPYLLVVENILDATTAPAASFVTSVIVRPLMILFLLTGPALAIEIIVTFARARRGGASSAGATRAVFGQPRWWLAWYPRVLRNESSSWKGMSLGVKALRTILFVELISLVVAIPLIWVMPAMVPVARGANLPLVLPIRVMITVGAVVKFPLALAFICIVAGILLVAAQRRVSPLQIVRTLVRA